MAASATAGLGGPAAGTAEGLRLGEIGRGVRWRRWGPYLSERQWGTVREDYSADGDAWRYFPHDHARSRAYRWGEDGIAGWGDDRLLICLSLALWNGRDPILKERLFGLTNPEGNHGEDVKELYYYLDGTPTHSYMRMLYKYPQAAFPYDLLVAENRRRGRNAPEFELIDTGVFADDRYFDVEVEYGKAAADDVLMRVTIHNCAAEPAVLHVLPQLWARNIWSWQPQSMRPRLAGRDDHSISIDHPLLPPMRLACEGQPEILFCDNDTNPRRFGGQAAPGSYFKDGINDYLVAGDRRAVSPARVGTKAAAHYLMRLPAGGETRLRLRLAGQEGTIATDEFDALLDRRRAEADEFYAALQHAVTDPDARLVHRQAFAGMLWTKQFYYFDIPEWLAGDPLQPPPPAARKHGRDADWRHLNNFDIIAVPDKWEYPWYAAWDLAFHAVILAQIDPGYAKSQLLLLTRDWYMHPNGQLPAYEWSFGDVNPPVQAWAAWRVYEIDREQRGGRGDRAFLERVFHKLMLNFTWWVNRKDVEGRNIFQGGFLGLDNIGIFDRSAPLPTGGTINQADGTAWMAMYTLNLMRIALELAFDDRVYEDIASKFFEHFLYIAEAMTNIGGDGIGLWDEADEFYYDALHLPGGERIPLKLRSMVGLIPLFAVEVARRFGVLAIARLQRPHPLVSRTPAAVGGAGLALARSERRRTPPLVALARPPHEATVEPDARRERIPVGLRGALAVEIPREKPLCLPPCRPADRGPLRPRRELPWPVRRQLELARADLVSGQYADHRVVVAVSQLLRRRLQGRMPGRLGRNAASGRSGRRAGAAPDPHFPARRGGPPTGLWQFADRTREPAVSRPCPVL